MIKFYKIYEYNDIPIQLHWSLGAILVFIVSMGKFSLTSFTLAISFVALMLLHEIGHALMARKYKYKVKEIRLYPFHGACSHEEPQNEKEEIAIASGGILIQLIFAITIIFTQALLPQVTSEPLMIILTIFGPLNLTLVILNLLPLLPFDGVSIWKIIPYWLNNKK